MPLAQTHPKRPAVRRKASGRDHLPAPAPTPAAKRELRDIDARVDEALAESFPASDPPPWTLGAPRWSKRERHQEPQQKPRQEAGPSAQLALKRPVGEIMRSDVRWVPCDMPLGRAARELAIHHISGAVVCDVDGRVVGVISVTDLTSSYGGAHEDRLVRDVMTNEIVTVRPDESLERAIEVMAFERVHRLVVIDPDGELAGIITSMDVLRELAGHSRATKR